jgi:hypothetical protein
MARIVSQSPPILHSLRDEKMLGMHHHRSQLVYCCLGVQFADCGVVIRREYYRPYPDDLSGAKMKRGEMPTAHSAEGLITLWGREKQAIDGL